MGEQLYTLTHFEPSICEDGRRNVKKLKT